MATDRRPFRTATTLAPDPVTRDYRHAIDE
jgi:hypothetical protein